MSRSPTLHAALRVLAHGSLCLAWSGCIGQPAPSVANRAAPSAPGLPEPPSLNPLAPAETGRLELDVSLRYQRLEGFGASLAWYQERVVGRTHEDLYQLLFPQLGLDILRLRNRFERSEQSDANLKQEQEIVERATRALGRRPRLMLSAWSPPARLKASGREKCQNNQDCTLKRENGRFVYEAYADWWRRSLEHYQALGLGPDYVSIQNEPSFIPPDWEGCKFEPEETAGFPGYAEALSAVHHRMQGIEPRPRLLGPEVLGVHYGRVQKYLSAMNLDLVDGIAHHLYERGDDEIWDWRFPGPDSYLDEMRGLARDSKKPLYSTEFNTDEDQGIEGGFETAWLMHHSLVSEGVVAFLYWDLVWVDNKGLASMNGTTPRPRDQYYSMRHFARYTDPGDHRVALDSSHPKLLGSAYLAPDEQRLTLVLLNVGRVPIDAALAPSTFIARERLAFQTIYRPGQSRRWVTLAASEAQLRLPARSVTTLVMKR